MIDFICELLAEWLECPCNYSPMDEEMALYEPCLKDCGEITNAECWKRYFGKAWADRKTEPQNYCDDCLYTDTCDSKDFFYACTSKATVSKMEQVETMSCAECKHRPIGAEICEEPCHYEPQTGWHYDEQDATWYPYKHEDEPQTETHEIRTDTHECVRQTDCPWKEPK